MEAQAAGCAPVEAAGVVASPVEEKKQQARQGGPFAKPRQYRRRDCRRGGGSELDSGGGAASDNEAETAAADEDMDGGWCPDGAQEIVDQRKPPFARQPSVARDVGCPTKEVPPHKRSSRGHPVSRLQRTSLCRWRRAHQELEDKRLAGSLAPVMCRCGQQTVRPQELSPQAIPVDDISQPDDVVSMFDRASPTVNYNA